LATSLVSPISSERLRRQEYRRERGFAVLVVTALTFWAVLVHGYHPYAEDGGVYLPEIKRLLDPGLYSSGAEFVVGHLRYSLFAPMVAGLVRRSHQGVDTVVLGLHVASFWMTLFAAWLLAARCFTSSEARWGAVGLLAAWMTLPVAGTSLMLMDPYVTARSLSTPCSLLALVGVLEFRRPRFEEEDERGRWRGAVLCGTALVCAGMMHPLMGAYGFGAVMLLGVALSSSRVVRVWGSVGLSLTAVAIAAALQMSASPESEIYRKVMLTRSYWYLSEWQWYEWVGLAAPLMILSAVAIGRRRKDDAAGAGLVRVAVVAGTTAIAVAVMFARTGMGTHLVARMQPLRIFQTVYVVMTLMVGGWLGEKILRRRTMRWVTVFSLLAGVMFIADWRTFPASRHLELPWMRAAGAGNQYEEAFRWIAGNTPRDAVFAQDADYVTKPGEDAQSFRAIAERSVLPDFSKDGGVVTNKPELANAWREGQAAQRGLDAESDGERVARLKPFGVTWVVLGRSAATGFACAFANEAVKVCRLP
jgi:hypothetical protein